MRLTFGDLLWPGRTHRHASYPPLRRDLRCEVAVIGAGVTGALIADALTASGMDVVLLDRRRVGCGSTSASTSLLLYETDLHLGELIRRLGEERAVRSWRLGIRAIDALDGLTRALGDRCGFHRKRSLYLASTPGDAEELAGECRLRGRYGMRVRLLGEQEIRRSFSFGRPAALLSDTAAQIDPFCLTLRFVERAARRGLRVHENTEVVGYERGGGESLLATAAGPTVRAGRVVFATGYATQQHLRQPEVRLRSTYVVASQPLAAFPGWGDRPLIWETARPYLYLRTTADGRALIGGADEEWMDPERQGALLPEKRRALTERFREMFPRIRMEPARAWAATFAETEDGLPYIGEHPAYPGALFALGYGGNGITFGVVAAEIVRDFCLGRPNPDAEIFRFGR